MDREFVINGKEVSFKTILKVYEKDKGKLVKFCRFLTQLDFTPYNIQRQKVKPALDIFRYEVWSSILKPTMKIKHRVLRMLTEFWNF